MDVSLLLTSEHSHSPSVDVDATDAFLAEDTFQAPETAMQLEGHGILNDGPGEHLSVHYLQQPLDMEHDEDAEGEPDFELEGEGYAVQLVAPNLERASSTPSSQAKPTKSGNKRKLGQDNSRSATPISQHEDSSTIAPAPVLASTPISNFFTTRNHPTNRGAFRYLTCGPSPQSTAQFPLYRVIPAPPVGIVRFSWEDRSTYIHLAKDASAITTEKGFRAARANVPIREGKWYFEIIIENGGGDTKGSAKADGLGPHVRLGIGRREAHLNAPVGFDGYSYGIRDRTGDKVHLSQPKSYGQAFGTGDVIGVYVSLPTRSSQGRAPITSDDPAYLLDSQDPCRIVRKRVPIRFKGQLYFESMEYAPSKEMEDLAFSTKDPSGFERALAEAEEKKKKRSLPPPPGKKKPPPVPPPPPVRDLPVLEGSKLAFFKNGECQGIAFGNLYDWLPLRQHKKTAAGSDGPRVSAATAILIARENHHDDGTLGYYPFVSVFGGAIARLNAGPNFRFPPPDDIEALLTNSPEIKVGDSPVNDPDSGPSWRSLHDRYAEYMSETEAYDNIDETVAYDKFVKAGYQHTNMAGVAIPPSYVPQASAAPTRSASPVESSPGAPATKSGKRDNKKGGKKNNKKKKTALSKELVLDTYEPEVLPSAGIESRGSSPTSAPSPFPGNAVQLPLVGSHLDVPLAKGETLSPGPETASGPQLSVPAGLASLVEREEAEARLNPDPMLEERLDEIVKMEIDQ